MVSGFHAGIVFVIPQTAEHTGIGLDAGELPDTSLQRIAEGRDEIAGRECDVRTKFPGSVDHAGQFPLAKKDAEVDIAQLQNAQPVEILSEARQRNVRFPNLEIGAFDECAIGNGREGSSRQRAARGVEHASPAGVGLGIQMFPNRPEQRVDGHPGGRGE